MTPSTQDQRADGRRESRGLAGGACLSQLRVQLARRCDSAGVRDAVGGAVGPLLGVPLVDAKMVRAADEADLLWSAQQVQRALNALDGARSTLAAEAARRQLHVGRGEASVAETLVRAAEAAWRSESDAERRVRQRAARGASMWIDRRDGMWHLRAKFDPLTGDRINRRLMQMIQRNWRSDKDLAESQCRSVAHRAADALAHLLMAHGAQPASAPAGDAATGEATKARSRPAVWTRAGTLPEMPLQRKLSRRAMPPTASSGRLCSQQRRALVGRFQRCRCGLGRAQLHADDRAHQPDQPRPALPRPPPSPPRAQPGSAHPRGPTEPGTSWTTTPAPPSDQAQLPRSTAQLGCSAQFSGRADGGIGRGRAVWPMSAASTAAAHARPSAMAHTIRLWPRPMSPQTQTPSTEVR